MEGASLSKSAEFKVLEKHRPSDATDDRARALFVTAALGIVCSKTLKEYMDHCDEGSAASGSAPVGDKLTTETYGAAVKELLSISIWLTLFEQLGSDLPEWFKNFILECHAIADKVQPAPSSKQIEQKYNLNAPILDICTDVSINMCNQLDVGATAHDAMLYLGDLLAKSRKERKELLEFGLTQPVAVLDERIKQI